MEKSVGTKSAHCECYSCQYVAYVGQLTGADISSRRRPLPSNSEKITFSLIRESKLSFSGKPGGSIEIGLAEILHQSDLQPGEGRPSIRCFVFTEAYRVPVTDIVLSLKVKGKDTCKLAMRITESSKNAFSDAVDHLQTLPVEPTAPITTAITNTTSAAGNTVTDLAQSDLAESLETVSETLLGTMAIIVKIGDDIAEVRAHCFNCHALLIAL